MKDILAQRLQSLRAEFEKGQERLRDLQLQQARLQETLLRLDGAMGVVMDLQAQQNATSTTALNGDAAPLVQGVQGADGPH